MIEACSAFGTNFSRKGGKLHWCGVNLEDLARRYGTPLYVYASDEVRCRIRILKNAFGAIPRFHLMYAVKANNNVEILKLIASEGVRFDCANLNEAALAMKVGAPYMLSGIFYTREELEAALRLKATVNLDDPAAWDLVKELLSEGAPRPKRLFIRLNPGWGRGAFSLILGGEGSKFGMKPDDARIVAREIGDMGIEFGVHAMVGSGIFDPSHFVRLASFLLDFALDVGAVAIDFGGGFGVPYKPDETELDVRAIGDGIASLPNIEKVEVYAEPGRYILASAGVLLCKICSIKRTDPPIVGLDGGMNVLMRPALYKAYHEIVNVTRPMSDLTPTTIVGRICESTDEFGRNRPFPSASEAGDIVAILHAGAYGYVMSSNYNSTAKPAEVMIEKGSVRLIRPREEPMCDTAKSFL